jgi:hypothetical protein
MQGTLSVAITLSIIVFALAALADGRGLRLLRWVVQFAIARLAARDTVREGAAPTVGATPVGVTRQVSAKQSDERAGNSHDVARNRDNAPASRASDDTRTHELTRR